MQLVGALSDNRKYGVDTNAPDRPGAFRRGNPGRPRGARNKSTLAALALLEGEAEALARKVVELALAGDMMAIKVCLDRLLPRDRVVRLPLPLRTLADLDRASGGIGAAVLRGQITPAEAGALAGLVDARRRVLEATELERRLAALEAAAALA